MSIHENNPYWILENAGMILTLDKRNLSIRVSTGSSVWETVSGAASIALGYAQNEQSSIQLGSAGIKQFSPVVSGYFQGIRIRLEQFTGNTAASGIAASLAVLMNTHTNELIFEVHDITGGPVREAAWPGAFRFSSEADTDYTVVPAMQGYMIPADWSEPVRRYHGGMMFGRDAYMPWWGQVREGEGYIAIIDTPNDARLSLEHIPKTYTHAEAIWLHSLETIGYTRRLRVQFSQGLDYVQMAKLYRKHVQSLGKLRTLTQKQAANPKLSNLHGAAVVHTCVHTHIAPVSEYYDKEHPELNDFAVSFDERARQLAELNERFGGKIYVHVDGWGLGGYDNQHPDVLPPSPKGGGWEGLLKLQETCRKEGILLAIHDNYRDYYYDAASYNTDLTIKDREGKQEYCDIWAGGPHSILCTTFSKGYVQRNYNTLKQNGVEPDGVYIDVFAVIPGDECYDPAHRMTRTESMALRAACFEEIRSRGMIISSEEPADWAVPILDLVHHAPYALYPSPGGGPAIGVPIPLFSLVYHDAIIVPWSMERGAWGIPESDLGFLHGLLNAGVPYLSITPSDAELPHVRTMARLHELVGFLEMTGHTFIDGSRRRQRSTFANGTIVEVDLDSDEFAIIAADGARIG